MYADMYIHRYMCMYIYICVYMYVYTYIYIYTHVFMHLSHKTLQNEKLPKRAHLNTCDIAASPLTSAPTHLSKAPCILQPRSLLCANQHKKSLGRPQTINPNHSPTSDLCPGHVSPFRALWHGIWGFLTVVWEGVLEILCSSQRVQDSDPSVLQPPRNRKFKVAHKDHIRKPQKFKVLLLA